MSYKTYGKYKNSNIGWIKLIPEHWNSYKLKHVVNEFIAGGTPKSSNDAFWDQNNQGIPWVAIGDMTDNEFVNSTVKSITREGLASKNLRILKKGTLIYSIFASLGKTSILNIAATTNQAILGLITSNKIDTIYLKYYLDALQTTISSFSNENTQENLNSNIVKNMEIAIPNSLKEQHQIANYLNKQTAKIDATIAKNEELIQLLEEKRVTLINQVVTKGLNPDVPMKDSGVEWIGEMPEHWEVRKFAHVANKIVVGYVGSIDDSYTDETGIPLIKTENVKNGKLNLDKLSYVTKDFHLKNKKSQIKPGDILIARHGESGRSCVVPESLNVANSLNIVILQSGINMDGYYYSYLLNSSLIQEYMQSIQGGAVQKVINTEDIAFLKVFVPSIDEQKQISFYLDNEINKIDTTISKIQENIALLEEYKTSLIYHVVTGKIDVREEVI